MGGLNGGTSGIAYDPPMPPSADPPAGSATTRPSPLAALGETVVVIWTIVAGVGLAAVLSLAPDVEGSRLVHFGLATITVVWIALCTLLLLLGLRRPLATLPAGAVSAVVLIALVGVTLVVHLVAGWTLGEAVRSSPGEWQRSVGRAVAIAVIVGLLGLAALHNHLRARAAALQATQAELEALHARIHPHFLFNTLNTATALVHARPGEAERLLLDLSDLFREALRGPRIIPLGEELALVRRYLEIEALRFGERLRIDWDLESPLPEVPVPALSIQPLVENAIRHGIEPAVDGGRVSISSGSDARAVWIEVRNSLPPADRIAATEGHRVGLRSAGSRISALTGGRGQVTTTAGDGAFVARVEIPRA